MSTKIYNIFYALLKKVGVVPFSVMFLCISLKLTAQFSALDNTFGQGGLVVQDVNGLNDYFFAHKQQTDGKTIAVGIGKIDSFYNHILAVRYLDNGNIDSSFANNGIFCKPIMQQSDEYAMALHILADGNILLAGKAFSGSKILVVRLSPSGEIDSSFGTDGHFVFSNSTYNHFASDIGVQSDGYIILTGFYQQVGLLATFAGKLTPQGKIDSSFGTNGWYISTLGNVYQDVQRLQIQPDDKIVLTSSTAINSNGTDILVTRLTPNGKLDSTFNQIGYKVIDLCCGEYCYAVKLQGDGKILLGGSGIDTPNTQRNFLLIRLHPDGRYDSSFNATGIVFTEINNQGSRIFGLDINPNGKIVATGYNADGVSIFNVAMLCYQTNGQLDSSFNNTGFRIYSFANAHEYPECITVQQDGKLVVSGFHNNGNSMNGFVIRLKGEWPVAVQTNLDSEYIVYPNPVQDRLYIQSASNKRIESIRIYNLYGEVVSVIPKIDSSVLSLSTATLSNGLYILEIKPAHGNLIRSSILVSHP